MPSPAEYQKNLPDLLPVVDFLTPAPGSCKPFDVVGNMDKAGYYDDLTFKVTLLGRVLSDVDEYALVDKRAAQRVPKTSGPKDGGDGGKAPEKELEPKLTLLEQVSRSLNVLHGKIGTVGCLQ